MPAACPTDCTGPARCWWSARWLRSAPCSSSPSRSVRLVRATPRQLDLLDACRRVLSIKDAVARGCRRVWPLNCHQWRCAGSVGECQSGSGQAAAVACRECEDVVNAKRAPVHRQKNRLFVRQTYGSSHTYLVSPTVSTVHTVRAHNVPVHAHCPSALAPRAPANGQLGAQPISMGESCAMQTVRYSRRGARQTDCRMAHRSSTPHTPTWSGHVHPRVDS